MTRRVLVGFAAFAGLFWAIAQFVYNAAALGQSRDEFLACGVHTAKDTLALLTLGVVAASVLAVAFAISRLNAAALVTLGVEAALVVAWFAVGGGAAAGCAIE
jgi:hypothetical protein